MGLQDIRNLFFPEPTIADTVPYAVEYAPEVNDKVICIARDSEGTVTAAGYPYMDNVERWYVEGETWADWLTIDELF